jgi:PHD/YefM family antitoxin component YafN of YafNO toxin-antitoxin module
MLIETDQMVPITRLQKDLTQTVRELSDSGKAVYILKNNNMEAALLSYQEYEYLKNIEEIFERYEINNPAASSGVCWFYKVIYCTVGFTTDISVAIQY